ncbi:MAG: hypothetical protein HUU46_06760 [Candidatus Hydrogenedentes bacterium]|nr:hypothetical protein [Candidatus Hydrogenedentota bacterium]
MRCLLRTTLLAFAALAIGCQSNGDSRGGAKIRLPESGTLFMKVFNEDPGATGPTQVAVTVDGQKVLDRNFSMDEKSYDGQYQIRLPQGKHVIEAATAEGKAFTSRAINLKDEAFLQIYVTEDRKFGLTHGSRRSLARLVIKRTRAAAGVNSNPALWMIIPAPQPSPSTREYVKNDFKAKAAEKLGVEPGTTRQKGKP